MTATFKTTITTGWGVAGPVLSGIRSRAYRLGLELKPFGFAKMHEIIKTYEVEVAGDSGQVHAFADWMEKFYPGSKPGISFEETA